MAAVIFSSTGQVRSQSSPLQVIAHRGASGYLPEHTLAAKALAYGMGADFIEQDVVLSKDEVPVVLHDIHLDTVTDVATRFPDRSRSDGKFYAMDFTLDELQSLQVHERTDAKTGQAVFPNRFPLHRSTFRIATLAEEIELIQGLNQSTGRKVGIYPEIKQPAWHRQQGKDISPIVIAMLNQYGYLEKQDPAFVQCFDADETRRIREELKSRLKLIQLVGGDGLDPDSVEGQRVSPAGLKKVAEYADGIGPALTHVIRPTDSSPGWEMTDLVGRAHALGLVVHPYTVRADSLPPYVDSQEQLVRLLSDQAQVDGLFTDFPDRARVIIKAGNSR